MRKISEHAQEPPDAMKLICVSERAQKCKAFLTYDWWFLTSAKLLLGNQLLENSIGMSYYAMYDSLTALLFKAGIKCENHSGSILLLKLIFDRKDLFAIISDAKKERIDKQYYITEEKDEVTNESAQQLLSIAEDFVLKLKVNMGKINNDYIDETRKKVNDV